VASQDRRRADGVLRTLPRADLEKALPPIRYVDFRVIEAVYATVRPAERALGGPPALLEVRFSPDLDAVWRITRIGVKEPDQ
jgi:hypothetical protein